MTIEIGSKYEGPCYDKPCLRAMPREWVLEEAKPAHSAPWFRRIELWGWTLLILFMLMGAAQAVRAWQ